MFRASKTERLRVQVTPDGTLKLRGTLAHHGGQIIKVIASRDTKSSDKILGCGLEIAVLFFYNIILRSSEVCVGRNGRCTFKA